MNQQYTLYKEDEVVGMADKTSWISHGMNIGVSYNEIKAGGATSGCCNAPLLKYHYSETRSWPVCSKCHYAFSNGLIEDNI